MIRCLVVEPHQSGQRLDRYIAEEIPALTRSYVQRLIELDHIHVNQRTTKSAYTIHAGDVITIEIPPPQPVAIIPEHIPLTIIYEDQDIVVVDKAAGMVVHPAPGHYQGTLVHALLARYPDMHVCGDVRPGIVHRLDQDTSGLIVVARNDRAMQMLTEQQKARSMHKVYLAIVEGRVKEIQGTINAPIGRHPHDRLRQAIVAHGREARTHYRVLEELGNYTLLEVTLETGRTHQIRVHLSYHHHPVLGDPLYGRRKPRALFGLKRQFLHAYRLGLSLPSDGQWREFTSSLPSDLTTVLQKLRSLHINSQTANLQRNH